MRVRVFVIASMYTAAAPPSRPSDGTGIMNKEGTLIAADQIEWLRRAA